MNEKAQSFLKLMFNENETICVSDSQFAYHSVPLSNILSGETTLVSPNLNVPIKTVPSDELIFVSLNPIKGFRNDQNCYKFRNFLVELDISTREMQIQYIKKLQIPYSAMVWSGSKSTHTLISLSEDLPSEKVYRLFSEWILNIITLADKNIKNPSRSIRIPGAIRPETGLEQELIEFNNKINVKQLAAWLNRYPDAKPQEKQQRTVSEKPDFDRVKPWVCKALVDGITINRNRRWFAVSVEFCLAGYNESDTIEILGKYFVPDRDFKEKEWETTIRSAFKWTYERKE